MPKKRDNPVPDDIKAMSFEEVKAAHEAADSPEEQARFDALVKARDEAQEALHARNTRNYHINAHYLNLLQERQRHAKKDE